jgi:thiamine biosynthesis lipoprotein
MSHSERPTGDRREFLTGGVIRKEVEWYGSRLADELNEAMGSTAPVSGPTVRLGTRAMATEFVVLMNPGPPEQVLVASDVLEEIHALEQEMTVYQDDGELAQLNRAAQQGDSQQVTARLFEVLSQSLAIAADTGGAYDPTSGPLIKLWQQARAEGRIPTDGELESALNQTGYQHVALGTEGCRVRYERAGLELNLGGIGKGFALDCLASELRERERSDWLMHGGKSSLLASGEHHDLDGWPVGVRNPLFPKERLATILLRNCGMSTSGAGVQFFRHEGKRYGHILDPRTGLPAEDVLSVTVLAPTAALADALSTAFFVMGLEKTRDYCDNHAEIGVLLIPPPRSGRRLKVHTFNLPGQTLFLSDDNELIDESA